MSISRIAIVGGSLAGLSAAEELRARGFDGTVTFVGAEHLPPYDRPPLSKQVLDGTSPLVPPPLRSDDEFADLRLDLRLGRAAVELDAAERVLTLDDGDRVPFDRLIITTGARARTVNSPAGMAGIHTLRTFDDARAVRAAFETGAKVAVIGAGFIGAEVAAAARSQQLDVSIVETLAVPLGRVLGDEIGSVCAALHSDSGVDLRCRVDVTGFVGGSAVEGLRLSDGSVIEADLVVVGVGADPVTDWLVSSGIAISDGVLCDSFCVTSVPGVFAAGDVARWAHPDFDTPVRIEHWSNAVEQGIAVARNLLAGPDASTPYRAVPYFWSDQYGIRIQAVGRRRPADEMRVVHGSLESAQFIAIFGSAERLHAAVAFGCHREFLTYRRLMAERATWSEAVGDIGRSRGTV